MPLLAGYSRGQPHQFDAFARRHAGGRLIHQKQPRLIGKRDGKLQPLEIAIGEFAAGALRITAHANQFEQAAGLRVARIAASRPRD